MEVLGLKLHFARKAWGVENWLDPDNATNTTETSVHGDGSWKCRKGQRVWVRPGMTQCCHDRHTDATWCPWGPDCKLCIEKQERSTVYMGPFGNLLRMAALNPPMILRMMRPGLRWSWTIFLFLVIPSTCFLRMITPMKLSRRTNAPRNTPSLKRSCLG